MKRIALQCKHFSTVKPKTTFWMMKRHIWKSQDYIHGTCYTVHEKGLKSEK